MQALLETVDVLLHLSVLFEGRFDLIDGVEDSCVVLTTELVTDLGQGIVSQFTGEVHGNLPGHHDLLDPFLAEDIALGNIVETGHLFLDLGDGNGGLLLLP